VESCLPGAIVKSGMVPMSLPGAHPVHSKLGQWKDFNFLGVILFYFHFPFLKGQVHKMDDHLKTKIFFFFSSMFNSS
jgi:hypothetical protein